MIKFAANNKNTTALNDVWNIISDIVLPHIGRIIVNIIGFAFMGLIVSVVLLIVMFRKKAMTRSQTAYQIIIRIIYIPLIVFACLYNFGNLGFIRGVYQVVSAENPTMVDGIYNISVNQFFASNKQKDAFVQSLKMTLQETESSGLSFVDSFEQKLSGKQEGKGFTRAIVSLYHQEIYKAIINGVFYAVDAQFNTETDHESLDKAIEVLYSTDRVRIEKAVKTTLGNKLQQMTDSHYHAALVSNLLVWIMLMSIPFIELIIYKQIMKRQQEIQGNGKQKLDAPGGN